MPRSWAENSKEYFALNEASRSNLNKNKRISKWRPFWNKVYGVFLQGFPVATVTFYVTKMTESFSAIIGVWYGTITLLLSVSILLIRTFLSSVEIALSHLTLYLDMQGCFIYYYVSVGFHSRELLVTVVISLFIVAWKNSNHKLAKNASALISRGHFIGVNPQDSKISCWYVELKVPLWKQTGTRLVMFGNAGD